jgi:hypothetical protein
VLTIGTMVVGRGPISSLAELVALVVRRKWNIRVLHWHRYRSPTTGIVVGLRDDQLARLAGGSGVSHVVVVVVVVVVGGTKEGTTRSKMEERNNKRKRRRELRGGIWFTVPMPVPFPGIYLPFLVLVFLLTFCSHSLLALCPPTTTPALHHDQQPPKACQFICHHACQTLTTW